MGHNLMECQDFLDLLSELEVLRQFKDYKNAEVKMFLDRAVAPPDKSYGFRHEDS